MSSSSSSSSSVSINALLKKTEHYDKDERYMATSDLCEVLKRHHATEGGKMDAATERRICTAVLRLLHDKSNDVQAVAVKTLGVLLTTVHEEQVLEICQSLADQVLDESKSELRDVYAIGLRTLCKTVPAPMGDRVSQRLVVRLLEGMAAKDQDIVLASLDVLTDLLGRFGATALSLTRQHEPILQQCLSLLGSEAHIVRKRSGNTIGCLSSVLSDALLVRMVESLLSQIEKAGGNVSDTRALIRTMCTVSGAVGHRLGQTQIDRILPIFLRFCIPDDAKTGDDDYEGNDEDMMDEDDEQDEIAMALANELRESCFNGFESFVARCPREVEPHLEKIIQAALAYMSYDPNYSYGDGVEEEEEDEYDDDYEDDDELEDDDEDDDDDDDDSWKVRRSAIRALTAVVDSKKHNPAMLWNKNFAVRKGKSSTVASAFVTRFKEREENCRVDIIDGFNRLLSVTVEAAGNGVVSFASENDMDTTENAVVIDFRAKYAEALVAGCEKLLSVKKGGDRAKSSALALLSTLCRAPGGIGGESAINLVFSHVKTFLAEGRSGTGYQQASTNKMLKLDALCLVRVMLECDKHEPFLIRAGLLDNLLEELCLAVKEKWYKVISEALRVLTEVPRYFLAGYTGSEDNASKKQEKDGVASSLYRAIEPLLGASDVDQEIKECALMATASLLSCLHSNLTSGQLRTLLKLLSDKLRNETTRIAAIKTLSKVAGSADPSSMVDEKIDLSPILGDCISVMASFLKQQNRSLKQHSLESLNIVITNHGSVDTSLADGILLATVVKELAGLVVDTDLHLSHLSMGVCVSTLAVCPACAPAVKEHVLPKALILSVSPVLQEVGLESLCSLFKQMIVSDVVDFDEVLDMLNQKAATPNKQAVSNVAKCIGVIAAATTREKRQELVGRLLNTLESGVGRVDVNSQQLPYSLMVSGDLGSLFDYNTMDGVADRLQKVYLSYFSSESDDIKQAASYALGRVSIGSQAFFLPAITGALGSGDEKTQYLLLSSLREFIRCLRKSSPDTITESIPVILPYLINYCSSSEEGARSMVAECLGSLACAKPDLILGKLQELVLEHSAIAAEAGNIAEDDEESKKNALVCWTVATSIKHAIAGKASQSALSVAMSDFLKLLKVTEVSVKNAALLMVYSAVHHMPQLVASFMKESVVPSLYEVAGLKLARVVDLGPFKHNVDDALPMRKSAMSIFATSLEKLPGSLDLASFMPVLAKALADLEDVQLQAHQIVVTMSRRYPSYLVAAVDDFAPSFEAMFTDKIIKRKTANKTGTELERAREWIKSGLRALLAMSKLDGVSSHRRFSTLVERVKANQTVRPMLDAVEEER